MILVFMVTHRPRPSFLEDLNIKYVFFQFRNDPAVLVVSNVIVDDGLA